MWAIASASPATWLKVAVRRSSVATRANRSLPSSCDGVSVNHESAVRGSRRADLISSSEVGWPSREHLFCLRRYRRDNQQIQACQG